MTILNWLDLSVFGLGSNMPRLRLGNGPSLQKMRQKLSNSVPNIQERDIPTIYDSLSEKGKTVSGEDDELHRRL